MSVTEQTNTTLEDIAHALCAHDDFCICGHVNPDGDCIGSQLGLALALRSIGKNVTCVLAQDDSIDQNLKCLPCADELISADSCTLPCEVFVAVDVPTIERLGEAATLHDAADLTITIDHHAVPTVMADMSYTDPDSASTTLLIWQIAKIVGVQNAEGLASCCYMGLMTDTGRFQFQNTDAFALEQAAEMVRAGASPSDLSQSFYQNRRVASVRLEGVALSRMRMLSDGAVAISWITQEDMKKFNAMKSDVEPLVDVLRCIAGVRVACILREHSNEVRGSFRAKDDTDVAEIAREFGGGGHKAAAGFTIEGTLDNAIETVSARLARIFSNTVAFDDATGCNKE